MNILSFYSNANTGGKHDATGAFIPYCKKFCDWHNVPADNRIGINCVNVSKDKRRETVFNVILQKFSGENKLDGLAFFCHGWPQGIQFGMNRSHLPAFAELLKSTSRHDLKVVFFACLTAENDIRDIEKKRLGPATDGGFADLLRDHMSQAGIIYGWVDGHKTPGDALFNPFVVRFPCQIRPRHAYPELYEGGKWLVDPQSSQWKKWCEHDSLDVRFPFMSAEEINAELNI